MGRLAISTFADTVGGLYARQRAGPHRVDRSHHHQASEARQRSRQPQISDTKGSFEFSPTGVEITAREVCDALMAQGITEKDALRLLNEAAASFNHP